MRTSGLFWSRELGPGPLAGMAPTTCWKGSDGPSMRPKKNAATT